VQAEEVPTGMQTLLPRRQTWKAMYRSRSKFQACIYFGGAMHWLRYLREKNVRLRRLVLSIYQNLWSPVKLIVMVRTLSNCTDCPCQERVKFWGW
jgi:hypothetical protein